MAGFPLSSMSSNSSLVVVRPAVGGSTLSPALSRERRSFQHPAETPPSTPPLALSPTPKALPEGAIPPAQAAPQHKVPLSPKPHIEALLKVPHPEATGRSHPHFSSSHSPVPCVWLQPCNPNAAPSVPSATGPLSQPGPWPRLTDLQLPLDAPFAALSVVGLRGVVLRHDLHKLSGQRGVLGVGGGETGGPVGSKLHRGPRDSGPAHPCRRPHLRLPDPQVG